MLEIVIPATEQYDPVNNLFYQTVEQSLSLEHSLISISKWEMKWNKPFISKEQKTREETLDYIRCMTLTKNVNPMIYNCINNSIVDKVNAYIDAPMTATWFSNKDRKRPNREIITSEVIYYWMIALNIPFECEKWHLNRLLTLISVCNEKNAPKKKMSKRQIMSQNRALNEARRKSLNSKG